MQIPIVETLQMKILSLSEGYCETMAPRKLSYDGVFESFHGGLLMTLADSTACFALFSSIHIPSCVFSLYKHKKFRRNHSRCPFATGWYSMKRAGP